MQHISSATYQPPKLRTFAQRKQEKERLLALAAGRQLGEEQRDTCIASINGGNRVSYSNESALSLPQIDVRNLP